MFNEILTFSIILQNNYSSIYNKVLITNRIAEYLHTTPAQRRHYIGYTWNHLVTPLNREGKVCLYCWKRDCEHQPPYLILSVPNPDP